MFRFIIWFRFFPVPRGTLEARLSRWSSEVSLNELGQFTSIMCRNTAIIENKVATHQLIGRKMQDRTRRRLHARGSTDFD